MLQSGKKGKNTKHISVKVSCIVWPLQVGITFTIVLNRRRPSAKTNGAVAGLVWRCGCGVALWSGPRSRRRTESTKAPGLGAVLRTAPSPQPPLPTPDQKVKLMRQNVVFHIPELFFGGLAKGGSRRGTCKGDLKWMPMVSQLLVVFP